MQDMDLNLNYVQERKPYVTIRLDLALQNFGCSVLIVKTEYIYFNYPILK